MAHSCISFAPITLDVPFQDAAPSNATKLDPHLSIVSRESMISMDSMISMVAMPSMDSMDSMVAMPSMREAPTQPAIESDSWGGNDAQPGSGVFAKDPEWCIDLADGMIALHAVELFARLATGEIPADTRVWRVGREAWTPAVDVPELRCAVEESMAEQLDALLDEPSQGDSVHDPFADVAFDGSRFDCAFDDDVAIQTYDGERPSLDAAVAFAQAG